MYIQFLASRCLAVQRLRQDRRAAVSIIVVAMMTAMVGVGAFAVELGQAYMTRARNQHIADTAAYGAAVIYSANPNSQTALTDAITRLTPLYGLPSGSLTASIVSSPTGDGNPALKVKATSS